MRFEIDYVNQKQERKRRGIVPIGTQVDFAMSVLKIVANCCTDNVEKHFRIGRVGKLHLIEV